QRSGDAHADGIRPKTFDEAAKQLEFPTGDRRTVGIAELASTRVDADPRIIVGLSFDQRTAAISFEEDDVAFVPVIAQAGGHHPQSVRIAVADRDENDFRQTRPPAY